jgi:hypothetical protein
LDDWILFGNIFIAAPIITGKAPLDVSVSCVQKKKGVIVCGEQYMFDFSFD